VRFAGVGGWDARVLPAQPVLVHGRRPLAGVVGSRPPHLVGAEERGKVVAMEDLFIDVGLPAGELGALVGVGDVVTMRRATTRLAGDRWAGKAMDNRASLVVLAVALEALAAVRHAWDVLAVATVQEEIGLRGAMTAAFGMRPTIAVAIDVGFAKQPGASEVPFGLGGGPMIACGPNIHPRMFQGLADAADALEMKVQIEALPGVTGTDAGALQVAREGVPTGLVGIPMRYMHSTVETVALRDVTRAGRLVARFVADLGPDFVGQLAEEASHWDRPLEAGGAPDSGAADSGAGGDRA